MIAALRYYLKSLRKIPKREFKFPRETSPLGRRPRSFAPERRCGMGGGGVRVLLLLPVVFFYFFFVRVQGWING
ncbi:hypothetical protein B9Z19DRAFT_1192878, partial [Tuber borchii]